MKLNGRVLTLDKISVFLSLLVGLAIISLTLPVLFHRGPKPQPVHEFLKPMQTPKIRAFARVNLPPPPPVEIPALSRKIVKQVTKSRPVQKSPAKKVNPAKKITNVNRTETRKPVSKSVKIESIVEDVISEGRVLLKLMEMGKGPNVELAWPEQAAQRQKLFKLFQVCLGLQTGLMTKSGSIYLAGGPRGRPAEINRDRTSLFLRQSTGNLPENERDQHSKIRAYHSLRGGQPVRLFSRVVDAALLGGIFRMVPENSMKNVNIQGRYGLRAGAITINQIVVNGRVQEGQVEIRTSFLGKCS